MSETMNQMNFIQAINQALADEMEGDEKVVLIGEDLADDEEGGVVGVTRGLSTRFGTKRVRSTPISEQAIVGAAIGAAMSGFKPVAEIMFMNFMTVCMDMITNHAAKLRYMSGGQTQIPLVIRTTTGAGFNTAGQHSDFLEAWFAHTAGLKVVAPSTPADAYGLLRSCIQDPDPCIFIENMPTYWTNFPTDLTGPILLGQAKVTREGTDLTIVSYSRTANESLAAAEMLAEAGHSVEVIDLRTVMPWDRKTVLESVAKTGRALVAHEAVRNVGVGAEIAAVIQEEAWSSLRGPVHRVGAPSTPVPFSKPLEDAFRVDAAKIAAEASAMLVSGKGA